ncbi:hypothetical protein O0I10_011014 [Lichtheimia ornata]|uniref:Uncharacterized protein n=1 Tax=Lichtheimia ornata TaxID=688661 RepID=A0AAD7XUH7_9FUNG|nr:uncharacterized protein O0I10_011014 [Lichtheimia ornata]KAJ8653363.1 hypothetical protein O0I10_011014 [Lichtheimia ornata]
MVILATGRSLSAFSARSRQQSNPLSCKLSTRIHPNQQQQQKPQINQATAFSTSARAQARYYEGASSPGSTSSESSSSSSHGPTITEQSILSAFPRPNLSPTLHFSIFSGNFDSNNSPRKDDKNRCGNCAGPHSTDFCPC